ncbi:MAG: phenylalanine--tRNA ligase subunit beta [Polyangiales bacterium]
MLASHAWLSQLTGLRLDPSEVAARLTSAGIEVEAVRHFGAGLERVVVAEVHGIRPHPKREKLRLVTVFDGRAEQEVVCGAPNVPPPGGRVVLAQLGATLPGGLTIAERDLAGVTSAGMLCSERELDAGSDESGILVLDAATAGRPGALAADALGLRDTVYELSLTPNRPDCLGHVGLARELCALFEAPFAMPRPPAVERVARAAAGQWPQRESVFDLGLGAAQPGSEDGGFAPVRVEIQAAERCPRYGAALVLGATVGPSPFWLRYRLHVLGLRALGNIIDATNYLLMLFGHPLHAFDYARLADSRIDVRLARPGERMRTLDGAERTLTDDDLLICDGRGPVALAGVMGGEGSQISPDTTRVLIECAYFDPRSVRRTSKRTGLHTDSSHRFERGVDSGGVRAVLAYASALIAELCGGTAVAEALDVQAAKLPSRPIALRSARVQTVLGTSVPGERTERLLRAIGCEVERSADGYSVKAPSHRPDIGREIDLIEELARLSGYDGLPSVLPRIAPSEQATPELIVLLRRLRELTAAAGLNEAVNYAFVSQAELTAARASPLTLRIVNPLSEERSAMRTSLLPGLGANLRQAQHQQQKTFAQFELARVFRPRPGQPLPEERYQLGLLFWGQRRSWYEDGSLYDFYDAKAAIEAVVRPLCAQLPATVVDLDLSHGAPELHPKRAAAVRLAGTAIGHLGELHPQVVEALALEGRPIWACIEVTSLLEARAAIGPTKVTGLPRFPSATRDLAVVVAEALPSGEVGSALEAAAGPLCEAVSLFDIYRGDPVPAGHKSLAFHLVYRDPDATLTDKVVDELHAKVAAAAEQRFSGSVRR